MIKYFTKILGIDNIPRWLLYHLMFFSLSLGGFQAILFVGAVSGFISANMLVYYPETIAFSGLLGIVLYSFYKYIIKSFSYRKALMLFYLVIFFVVFLAEFLPKIFAGLTSSVLLFIVYIPTTIIAEQFISGISDRVPFQKYQQNLKRYSGAIYLAGSFIFSIALVIGSILGIKPYIFLPSVFLLGIAAIESNFILKKLEIKKSVDENKIESIISMFSDLPLKSNILSVLLFLFLSGINFICIDYTFMDKIGKTYESYANLVQFIGMFFAGLMCITLLFKLFVFQNLIKTFRINKAIYLSPVFMLFAMLLLNGLNYIPSKIFGNNQAIYLFVLIVFARFFAYVLKESFELYSVRMVFSAISCFSKKLISPNTNNLLILWGYLFSGLVLLLTMSFDLFNVRNIIVLNTIFVVLWIVVSAIVVKKYAGSLGKIIDELSTYSKEGSQQKNLSLKERVMITTNLSGLKYLLNFQRYYQPFDFEKKLEKIPANMQNKLGLTDQLIDPSEYSTHLHEPSKYQTGKSDSMNFYDSDVSLKLTDIESLASSIKIKDRIRAVNMIENSQNYVYAGIFKMLIRDSDEEVKRNGLMAAVTYYNSDILQEIIKYINHDEFSTLVSEVLSKIGDEAIPSLANLFYRKETDLKTQVQILKIIGKIASQLAIEFLIDQLNYPNKLIIKETISTLYENKLNSNLRNNSNLHQAIFKTIGILAWLLAKNISIDNISKNEPLKKALNDEYNITMEMLFNLLHLKYQSGLIEFVNNNINQLRTNEQMELYVELLNYVIDDDIKVKLFPLLHNNQNLEKIEQLKQFYPIEKSDVIIAVKDLLNADYEYVSVWTRACALKYYIELQDDLESEEIIAQVFNPELMIAELAFFGIYKKDPQVIARISDRLPVRLKNRILSVLKKGTLYEYCLIYNKVLSLQKISYFQKMMGLTLVPFAEILNEIILAKDESTYLKCSEEEVLPVFFEPYGDISLIDMHKRKVRLTQNYLYGLGLYAGGVSVNAFSDSVLYIAQPEQIGYLVIHYEELSDALFKYIQNSNFY
jgi:ATP:ADP antiporter, AAA family